MHASLNRPPEYQCERRRSADQTRWNVSFCRVHTADSSWRGSTWPVRCPVISWSSGTTTQRRMAVLNDRRVPASNASQWSVIAYFVQCVLAVSVYTHIHVHIRAQFLFNWLSLYGNFLSTTIFVHLMFCQYCSEYSLKTWLVNRSRRSSNNKMSP